MSGTSLDAIDLVYVKLVRNRSWNFQILKTKSIEYSCKWRERLTKAIDLSQSDLEQFNNDYTQYLGSCIKQFINDNLLTEVLAVCSHGHTIHHLPDQNYTLQIGNLPQLAKLLNHRVVCDYRIQDVLKGGQGAPLVPIGDHFLFPNYDFCLNLGGFANISFELDGVRKAFDIVPVNVVLNKIANQLGADYDNGGDFAKAGKININVLTQLNALSFYKFNGPKSLGVEWVQQNIWDIVNSIVRPKDALATFTEHVAIQISNFISSGAQVLITGGGAYNSFLVDRISFYSNADLVIPDNNLIEYKEALIFAFLGVLKLRNEDNCLASVTGAYENHSSGRIYLP